MPYSHDNPRDNAAARYTTNGVVHGVITCALGLFFTSLLQVKGYVPDSLAVTLVGGAIGYGTGFAIARTLFGAGARLAGSVYAPGGDTTKYTPTFSHIEALEVRGDLDGAAAAWDAAVAEHPESLLTQVRAADFHLRLRKDPAAALERYLRARSLGSGAADTQRYVQQKIVDLYLGPLRDEGRAMVELRRLIDGHPGSREAEGARAALTELKSRRAES
ncbi:MAG TPA: hypothetical protein PK788_11165 [Gemmatimonadaceae bacterium]|nr:hypothetical protein [Gemmatimonadaceae bacterium]HRQ78143.1 hypothetical protein [Gemmatimonadaceae bacterium]